MSAELAMITGLGIIAFILIKLAKEIEDAETQINQGLFTLSILFMVGLEYTAYGIAQSQNLQNAELAYLAALLITLLAFFGLLAQFVGKIKEKAGSDEMEGL